MSVAAKDTIKQWFQTGDEPTQEQFWTLIDSLLHVNDEIPINKITNLQQLINSLPTKAQIDALLAAIQPQVGNSSGLADISFPVDTIVSTIEIRATADGICSIGAIADSDEYGSGEYVANKAAVFVLHRAFDAGEHFFITTTTAINYSIRKL